MSEPRSNFNNSMDPGESRLGLDGIILAISALVFCTSLFFLFQNDSGKKSRRSLVALGEFSKAENDVRRRTGNGVQWQRIDQKDVVYDGDNVYTGGNSSATLTLSDGSRIVIEEKSLVMIRTEGKNPSLDLQYGSVTGRIVGRPLLANVNGQKTELRSNEAGFRLTTHGLTSQTASNPLPSPQEPAPAPTTPLSTTEQASSAPTPLPSATPRPPAAKRVELELLSPQNGESLWLSDGEPAVFRWRELFTDVPPHTTTVEFALDTEFKKPIGHTTVAENELRLPSDRRPSGTFYWRARNVGGPDGDSLPTLPRQASFHVNAPPDLQVPFDGQELTFNPEAGEKNKQVVFAWGDRSLSTEYEVQLARDRNFESLLLNRKVKRKSEYSPLLPKGTYYWRVAGLHPGRKNPPWSQVVRFVVEEETKTLGTPVLKQTSILYQLNSKEIARIPTNPQGGGRGLKPAKLEGFTWEPVERAIGYEVEISTDTSFDTSLKLPIGKVTKYVPPEVRPGLLYFRVRAIGKKDLESLPSQTGKLEIRLPAPSLEPITPHQASFSSKVEYDAAMHDFQLKWSPLPFVSSYEVEFATSPDFSDAQKMKSTALSKNVSATLPSEYHARVRGLASNGSPISEFSKVQVTKLEKELALPPPPVEPVIEKLPASITEPEPVVVAAMEPLAVEVSMDPVDSALGTPGLKEPFSKTQLISVGGASVFVNFKWTAQVGANGYEIQISKDPKFKSSIETIETPKVDLLLQQKLPKGRVYWRVRAKSETGYSNWSEPNLILVQYR